MKSQFILVIFCIFLFYGCKQNTSQNSQMKETVSKEKNVKPKYGKKYFDYDQIDYYSADFEEDKIKELDDNQEKSKVDKYKYTVLIEDTPETMADLDFLHYMKEIGFTKKQIDRSKFKQINNIFVEKTPSEGYSAACVPVFRDILIFKKDKKVVGIAKICFGCHQYRIIIGTDANTENFGMDNDYENLGNILDNLEIKHLQP